MEQQAVPRRDWLHPEREHEDRHADRDECQDRVLARREREGQLEQCRADDDQQHIEGPGEEHGQGRGHRRHDPLAVADGLGQDREIVADEHEVGDTARGGAAALHRHAHIRGPDRQDVVHAVAGHRDITAARLEDGHEPRLQVRIHSAEDRRSLGDLAEGLVVKRGEIQAGRRPAIDRETQPAADGLDRVRVVAGHDLDVDAALTKPVDRRARLRSKFLRERQQGERLERPRDDGASPSSNGACEEPRATTRTR